MFFRVVFLQFYLIWLNFIAFSDNTILYEYLLGCVYLGPYEGGKPDASFSFKDEDFVKVALGKMNPQIAFMRFNFSMDIFLPKKNFVVFFFFVNTSMCFMWWRMNVGVR